MRKTKRKLRKSKYNKKRSTHFYKKNKKDKTFRMRKSRKSKRFSHKNKKYRGGGLADILPQDIVNAGRSVQDYWHELYQDFTGSQNSWSNSNAASQGALLSNQQVYPKTLNLNNLSERASLQLNNLLNSSPYPASSKASS